VRTVVDAEAAFFLAAFFLAAALAALFSLASKS
jgi:hypothetical protein